MWINRYLNIEVKTKNKINFGNWNYVDIMEISRKIKSDRINSKDIDLINDGTKEMRKA